MNTELHIAIIKLIIAYTLAGAVVFTVIATCLSLVGIIKFADKAQQNKLFTILLVELVTGCVSFFLGFLQVNPKAVQRDIEAPLQKQAETLSKEAQDAKKQTVSALKKAKETADQLAQSQEQLSEATRIAETASARSKRLQAENDRLQEELKALKSQDR